MNTPAKKPSPATTKTIKVNLPQQFVEAFVGTTLALRAVRLS